MAERNNNGEITFEIMERGGGYAGEGDVLTAGLVGALMSVYPETTFTEMFCPDWKEDKILLSHMGESNPRLASWKPLLADTPFNYNSCGNTVAEAASGRYAVQLQFLRQYGGYVQLLPSGEGRLCQPGADEG